MTVTLYDMLSALCSHVEGLPGNDTQDVFYLSDTKEAKLAYEIITTQGFEAKLYTDNGQSKLYVTRPADELLASKRLDVALAYAQALKPIKRDAQSLCQMASIGMADFTLTFANAAEGKQISIYLHPASASSARAASTAARLAPAAPIKQAAPGNRPRRNTMMDGGTALAKTYPIAASASKGGAENKGFKKWLYRNFILHVIRNGVEILTVMAVIFVVFGLAVTSKGFLCPDLATVKSRAWYCNLNADDPTHPSALTNIR